MDSVSGCRVHRISQCHFQLPLAPHFDIWDYQCSPPFATNLLTKCCIPALILTSAVPRILLAKAVRALQVVWECCFLTSLAVMLRYAFSPTGLLLFSSRTTVSLSQGQQASSIYETASCRHNQSLESILPSPFCTLGTTSSLFDGGSRCSEQEIQVSPVSNFDCPFFISFQVCFRTSITSSQKQAVIA